MLEVGGGALLVTSATRGKAHWGFFASTKAAQRILAESIAREFGPQGIRAYFIIDAAIDTPRTRPFIAPDAPDEYFAKPAAIRRRCTASRTRTAPPVSRRTPSLRRSLVGRSPTRRAAQPAPLQKAFQDLARGVAEQGGAAVQFLRDREAGEAGAAVTLELFPSMLRRPEPPRPRPGTRPSGRPPGRLPLPHGRHRARRTPSRLPMRRCSLRQSGSIILAAVKDAFGYRFERSHLISALQQDIQSFAFAIDSARSRHPLAGVDTNTSSRCHRAYGRGRVVLSLRG